MSIKNDRGSIEKKVVQILENKFGISPEKLLPDNMNENLLGYKIRLKSRDLFYMFFFIQEEFNIKIYQESILKGEFVTIQGIVDIISDNLRDSA